MTFLDHVAIAAPRNGTTSHTVDPNGGTVVTGSNFSPTSGRLLICVCEGAVTSTTPSGWTLPTNGSAINNTGLYVWHKTATGGDTLSTTHNGSNYPCIFHFFQFAAGSSFTSCVSSTGLSASAANPNLTSLTGTKWVAGVKARGNSETAAVTYAGAWDGSNVEILDTYTPIATTDGYWCGISYQAGYATSSYQPTCTVTTSAPSITYEALTFALNEAGGTSGTATPARIVTTAALPAATPQAGTVTSPAAIARSLVLPAATPQASKTTAPAMTVTTATMPAATPQASSSALPAAISLPVTLPAATATGATTGTATPATITATITLPAASASGATAGTATPVAIVTTATLGQATATASRTIAPGVVTATVTLPAASASGASPGTATPAAVTATVTMPQATVVAGSTVGAQPVTLTVTMPQATPQASKTATPAMVPLVVAMPAATRSGGSSGQPNAVALVTVIPAPFLVYGYRVNPDAIRLTIAIAAALAQGIEPDAHPITVTMRDRGHTITVAVTGTRATARETTSTTARQGR